MRSNFFLLFLLWIVHAVPAQQTPFKIPDSLQKKDFDYLDQRIDVFKKDSLKASVYMHSYVAKANAEKNWQKMINGYQNLLHQSPEKVRLVYADSMIYAAKQSKDNALIGASYLSRGIVYYGQKKHRYALDNYLIANRFISRTNDQYLIYKVKYNIAQIKYYLGFYDEAIALFRECTVYFKNENPRPYLNSLHSLGLCYNKIGNYGLCSQTNEIGLTEGNKMNNTEMNAYFIHSEGVNQYFKQNYASAISNIARSLPAIYENNDFANEAVGNFYIGKSYWDLKKPEKALPYFHKVDQTFQKKGYIRPDLREVYELLIRYYKTKEDSKIQLHYIDQLLKADTILNTTYSYLIGKVKKEYDTTALLLEKKKIENLQYNKKFNDTLFISLIILLFLLLAYVTHRHRTYKSIYRLKFEELMRKNEISTAPVAPKRIHTGTLDISQDAVSTVLKQLLKFERDKKFLEKDLTLVKLSAAFDSNTKYLSKIIYHYRGKKFVEYLNDLKVDYLISLLKTEKMLRNYTNKALAEEAGFSSTQRFANAFYSRTRISPTYFIQQLKKEAF